MSGRSIHDGFLEIGWEEVTEWAFIRALDLTGAVWGRLPHIAALPRGSELSADSLRTLNLSGLR